MAIPFIGRGARELSRELLESAGVDREVAGAVSWVVGIGVTAATVDWASAGEHLVQAAEFAAQGDWHP